MQAAAENIYNTTLQVQADNAKFAAGLISYQSKVYDYAWMSPAQFISAYGGALPLQPTLRKRRSLPQSFIKKSDCVATNLPSYKNWVEEKKLSPVQNQNPCGDCYVFTALAVVESLLSIASGFPPVKLSEMQVTECKHILIITVYLKTTYNKNQNF